MRPYYTIVCKPLSCRVWTVVHKSDLPRHARGSQSADIWWSSDHQSTTERCQHLNSLGLRRWLAGDKAWDRFEFRVAKVGIEGHAPLPPPKGDSVCR